MRRALRRLFLEPEPPLVAVEFRPRCVGVVRIGFEKGAPALAAAASLELPEGALRLSISESNVLDPGALRAVLRSACERAGVLSGARVALVLPDPVARIAMLPADEVLSRGAGDPQELVRFRLRKALPFEVRESRVALRREGDQALVVAAARQVLDPYEEACRDCGLEPGRVELSGLVLMDAVLASRPPGDRLVVNWDDGYVSLLLVRAGSPALVRTLTGPGAVSAEALRREIDTTLVYYRERLGGQALVGLSVRSAVQPVAEVEAALGQDLGAPVEAIEVWSRDDARLPLQALAGAAASLFRRVA